MRNAQNRTQYGMSRIFMLARRVIQQLIADRRTMILILIVPLVILTVMGVLLRTQTNALAVGVVMQDAGATSILGKVNLGERLVENMRDLAGQSSTIGATVQVSTLEPADAELQITAGSLDAVITLPPDFSQHTMDTRELSFPVLYEGSNPMTARILEGLVTRAAVQSLASLSAIASLQLPPLKVQATYRYGSAEFDSLDYLAPALIGMFVFLFVFILTSVSFLRERSAGTLERLQATPIRRSEIVLGYVFGFSLFALIQALIVLVFTVGALQVHYLGSLWAVFAVELLLALMAVNLGIYFSMFARNEFQIVQFIPLVVVTQLLLSGALWPIESMPSWLQPIAWLMPLTYATSALRDVMIKGFALGQIVPQILAMVGFAAAFVLIASQTIRQQARSA